MPKYQVALDNGRKFMVEATAPPSEEDVYAALAQQENRQPAKAEDFIPKGPEGSAASRYAGGLWDTVNPVGAVKGVADAVMHPVRTASGILDQQKEQFVKAKADYDQGHYSEMLGHGLAGAIPLIGPAAARAGEAIGSGDVAGGLGQATGLVGGALIGAKAPGAAGEAVEAGQRGLQNAAESIVSSSLKVPKTLTKRNRSVNIPRVVLDEGFGAGKKGLEKAKSLVEQLSNDVSGKVQASAASGKKFSLQPLMDQLDALEAEYQHQPTAAADLAAVRSARQQLLDNPLYGEDIVQQVQTQVPGSILGPNGQPMMTTQTTNKVVGRRLKPQDAPELDRMKKNVYAGLKGKYGSEKSGVIEADKATGRGLKEILDTNVPGVADINKRQSGVIAARNALDEAQLREANKYGIGLMDIVGIPGIAAGVGAANPLIGVPAAALEAWALLTKHPTTAMPVARTLDKLGHATSLAKVSKAAGTAGVAGKVVDNGLRPITKQEAQQRYQAYLAAIEQQ